MKKLAVSFLVLSMMILGCSEQTQQETAEALEEAGEAVSSAVEDAAENTEQAAKELGDAIDTNDSDPDGVEPPADVQE